MTRCADASQQRGETLGATASTYGLFLLMEDPGPWGPHVLQSARLPDATRAAVRGWVKQFGVRPLLIRRPGRSIPGPRRIIVANVRRGWMEETDVTDLAEVAHLDLSNLRGETVGLTRRTDPVVLVCTHGRHDPCCAVRGRPVAAALAASHPRITWEASHVGGDRFAANVVMLPRGDYFGRVDPSSAPDLVRRYLDGELDLDHHRGRSVQPWAVQAAVGTLRRDTGERGLDTVGVGRVERTDTDTRVELRIDDQRWEALVTDQRTDAARLTCTADRDEPALAHGVRLRRI